MVDSSRQVQLRAAVLVDAEVVALHPQPPTCEEFDQVLVAAARAAEEAETARESPLEPVTPDREVRAEAPVDEVAPGAVVEPVVLDGDVLRPPEDHEAVRPLDRAIPAVRKRAAADRDVPRCPRGHRRGEIRSLRGDDEVRQVDVLGLVEPRRSRAPIAARSSRRRATRASYGRTPTARFARPASR